MLRLIRPRDKHRPADVLVGPRSNVDRDAITTRTGGLTPPPDSDTAPATPRSFDGRISSSDIDADELIFESIEPDADRTPVTLNSDWQRNAPPPLPDPNS